MSDTYVCALCGGEFEKTTADDEAMAECREIFGAVEPEECDIVCDDCFQKIDPRRIASDDQVRDRAVVELMTTNCWPRAFAEIFLDNFTVDLNRKLFDGTSSPKCVTPARRSSAVPLSALLVCAQPLDF